MFKSDRLPICMHSKIFTNFVHGLLQTIALYVKGRSYLLDFPIILVLVRNCEMHHINHEKFQAIFIKRSLF